MAYDVSDFQHEVIETSYKIPVLVDFWAPWCGPCRVLGPVLEKLAEENDGRWKLAKLNTDQNQNISQEYGIRGIPAVKLFVDGNVVNEFTGALPEHMLRKWLDESLPSEEKMQLESAQAALEAGQVETARAILESLLTQSPNDTSARLLLARLTAQTDLLEARRLIEGIDGVDPEIEAIHTLSRLVQIADTGEEMPDEKGKDEYRQAIFAVKDGEWDTALQLFIAVIQQNRYYDDDGPRKACIALFNLLGATHPVTRKHRRMFDMVLY